MPSHNRPQFFLSIATAMFVGVGIAYIGIMTAQLAARPQVISQIFSRTFVYAAEENEEEVEDDITLTGESIFALNPVNAISATAYGVQSLDKGNVLVEKDSDRLLPIASVTKLITAVVAKKLYKETDSVVITSKMLVTEGNTGKLRLGEKYKIGEILYPLLMVSSNDSAEAIAQTYDAKKGKGKFVKEMNEWVNSIGAFRTYFHDASGLSPQNVSTVHDISIIAKWIKENEPEIFDITLTKAKSIRTHTWTNPTHFLSLSSYGGGKNGYTPEASLTNVSIFALGSPARLYSVVLLGSKNRDKDTLAVLNQAVK